MGLASAPWAAVPGCWLCVTPLVLVWLKCKPLEEAMWWSLRRP